MDRFEFSVGEERRREALSVPGWMMAERMERSVSELEMWRGTLGRQQEIITEVKAVLPVKKPSLKDRLLDIFDFPALFTARHREA